MYVRVWLVWVVFCCCFCFVVVRRRRLQGSSTRRYYTDLHKLHSSMGGERKEEKRQQNQQKIRMSERIIWMVAIMAHDERRVSRSGEGHTVIWWYDTEVTVDADQDCDHSHTQYGRRNTVVNSQMRFKDSMNGCFRLCTAHIPLPYAGWYTARRNGALECVCPVDELWWVGEMQLQSGVSLYKKSECGQRPSVWTMVWSIRVW